MTGTFDSDTSKCIISPSLPRWWTSWPFSTVAETLGSIAACHHRWKSNNESSLINNNVTFFQFCGTLKKMMGVRRSTSSTDITLATRLTRLEVVLDRMIWNFLFRCHTLDEGHFLLSICSMQTCCSVDYIGKYPITLIHGRSKGEALALKSSKNLSTFLGPRGPHGIPLSAR